jgi:protein-S-isoprenylcysteine O-methyltransferase Ste14
VGPRLALITLPYVILAIIFINREPGFLAMHFLNFIAAEIIGYSLLGAGLVFYILSAMTFFRGFKDGKLITHGPYGLCRNPIYATFIVFFIPALVFLFRSGVVLSIDVVLYLNFKVLIHEEYELLRKHFGEDYNRYEKAVNEILPIPKRRIKEFPGLI